MLGERSLQTLQIGTGCRYRIQVLLKVGDQRLWSASRVVGDSREHIRAMNQRRPGVVCQRFGSTDRQAFSRTGEHRFGVSVALRIRSRTPTRLLETSWRRRRSRRNSVRGTRCPASFVLYKPAAASFCAARVSGYGLSAGRSCVRLPVSFTLGGTSCVGPRALASALSGATARAASAATFVTPARGAATASAVLTGCW